MGVTITTRVPKEIERRIKIISKIENLDRSTVIRRLLAQAIKEWQIDYVLEQYKQGRITLWKAARDVGLSLREMIALASKKGIPFQYTIEDLREDFRAAIKS